MSTASLIPEAPVETDAVDTFAGEVDARESDDAGRRTFENLLANNPDFIFIIYEGNEKEDAVEGVQKAPGGEMAGSVCTELTTANRRVVAVFFYIAGADIEPCYAGIEDGAWLDPSPYGVVHRIASDGSVKGAGSFCIRWAYEQCGHLRIDTHPDNKVMQGLLAKLGFRRCGIIHVVEDHDPRYAYELTEIQRG